MQEEWVQLHEFPDYEISNYGEVRNLDGRTMTQTPVQYNLPTVGLRLRDDRKTYRRSVPKLVAQMFLPDPENDAFDTPIHLDGDRSNTRVDNLMWRPLWFAIQYHKEARSPKHPSYRKPIVLMETGERFETVFEAKKKYGLLEFDIIKCLHDPTEWVFPGRLHFRYAD